MDIQSIGTLLGAFGLGSIVATVLSMIFAARQASRERSYQFRRDQLYTLQHKAENVLGVLDSFHSILSRIRLDALTLIVLFDDKQNILPLEQKMMLTGYIQVYFQEVEEAYREYEKHLNTILTLYLGTHDVSEWGDRGGLIAFRAEIDALFSVEETIKQGIQYILKDKELKLA